VSGPFFAGRWIRMIVGLTGSIGTGKSTVAAMFGEMGAEVIDFDRLAHEVILPPSPAWREIAGCFGEEVLRPDRTIDRAKLARVVFNDPARLDRLNRIVHPAVFAADRDRTTAILAAEPQALIIKDIPLLTEDMAREMVDKVVVVYASPVVQMERLRGRGLTWAGAERRIAAQMPVEEKLKFADFVINNNGTVAETKKQVAAVLAELTSGPWSAGRQGNSG